MVKAKAKGVKNGAFTPGNAQRRRNGVGGPGGMGGGGEVAKRKLPPKNAGRQSGHTPGPAHDRSLKDKMKICTR